MDRKFLKMKKLIYSIATLSMLLGGQTANAQLTFFESNNGIPSNFYVNGIVPVTSSEIYIAGAINNSPGWVHKIYKSNDGEMSFGAFFSFRPESAIRVVENSFASSRKAASCVWQERAATWKLHG